MSADDTEPELPDEVEDVGVDEGSGREVHAQEPDRLRTCSRQPLAHVLSKIAPRIHGLVVGTRRGPITAQPQLLPRALGRSTARSFGPAGRAGSHLRIDSERQGHGPQMGDRIGNRVRHHDA